MVTCRPPLRWCCSGRQLAAVLLLLACVYLVLVVHLQPLVSGTGAVRSPVAGTDSVDRSPASPGGTAAPRAAPSVGHQLDLGPAVTREQVRRQPAGSARDTADRPAGQADRQVNGRVTVTPASSGSGSRDATDGNHAGRDGDSDSGNNGDSGRDSDSDSNSDSDSDSNNDSGAGGDDSKSGDSIGGSNSVIGSAGGGTGTSRCVEDRVRDTRAGRSCAEASRHGPGQRVISYSLFQADGGPPPDGTSDQQGWGWLLEGLDVNAELSARLYPGWRIRVYHDTAAGSGRRSRLAAAACRHRHVDLCFVQQADIDSKGVYRGALWRFFPLADPLVEAFVSRDLDSRLSHREVTAVQHWLATNKTFHIMRDHWDHLITVPGGLWGARPSLRRPLAEKLGSQLNKWLAHPGHKNWDQRALQSVVWFHAAVDSVQHDSYTCQRFPGYTVPFPSRRSEDDTTQYLGQVVRYGQPDKDEKLLKCPPSCRPKDHPDWEYC